MIAATHPLQCTGYARVGATLANGFVDRGHEVTYWGFQNLSPMSGRAIHPKINVLDVGAITGDPWGFGESKLAETVSAIRPDCLILYNDVMVLNRFLDMLDAIPKDQRPTIVCYVDLVHDDQDPRLVHGVVTRCDHVWVFADHWRDALLKTYPDASVKTVPHGMDATMLEITMTKHEARDLLSIPKDAFVVVNTNRNSYRKAIDLTIDSFLRFWTTHRDAVLVLNNNEATESGYDMTYVIISCCRRLGLENEIDTILNRVILRIQNGGFMPDRMIAALHIASDVGVNTCLGEGFGLCQLEGACLGRPQIATKTGGLIDILGDDPAHHLIEPSIHLMLPRGFVMHSGVLDIPDTKDVTTALEHIYDTRPVVETDAIRRKYDWKTILDEIV